MVKSECDGCAIVRRCLMAGPHFEKQTNKSKPKCYREGKEKAE